VLKQKQNESSTIVLEWGGVVVPKPKECHEKKYKTVNGYSQQFKSIIIIIFAYSLAPNWQLLCWIHTGKNMSADLF